MSKLQNLHFKLLFFFFIFLTKNIFYLEMFAQFLQHQQSKGESPEYQFDSVSVSSYLHLKQL